MPTHTSSQMDKPAGRPARLLLGLTGALLALLILNLAVFDDLRIDPSAGVLETFAKPQHLSSLVAVLIAAALVAFKHRSAARVAVVVAWIEIVRVHVLSRHPGGESGPPSPTGVTAWETRCSGWASCRSSPSAPPSSRVAALAEAGRHTGRREPAEPASRDRDAPSSSIRTPTPQGESPMTAQLTAAPSWDQAPDNTQPTIPARDHRKVEWNITGSPTTASRRAGSRSPARGCATSSRSQAETRAAARARSEHEQEPRATGRRGEGRPAHPAAAHRGARVDRLIVASPNGYAAGAASA